MSFALFLLYVAFSFLRPVEMYLPELANYRPMLILWTVATLGGLVRSLSVNQVGGKALHFWLIFAFTIATTAGHAVHGYLGGVIASLSTFSTSSMFFLLVLLNVTDMPRLRITCITLLLSILTLCGLAIASYHTGYQSENLVLWQSTGIEDSDEDPVDTYAVVPAHAESSRYMIRMHAMGFLSDPNDFAQAIVLIIPLLGLLYLPGRTFRNVVLVLLPASAMFYAIYLTHSRGAILGLAALLFFGIRQRLGNTLTFALVAIIAIAPSLAQFGGGRAMSSKEESAAQRIEAWYEGFQMFRSNPLFGVGFDTFHDHHYLTAHNSFVLCFAELGLVGFFFWISLIVVSYQGLGRVIQYTPNGSREYLLASMLRSGMIGYLTCAWFLSRTYQPGMYLLFALCIATWCSSQVAVRQKDLLAFSSPLPWVRGTAMLMLVSMMMVYAFILMSR